MEIFSVKQYKSDYYEVWNQFVSQAKNATFLFHRDFMEYHSDRFEDFSLLVFDMKEKLVAILPANRVEDTIFSHQGLTYGGLLFKFGTKAEQVFKLLDFVFKFLEAKQIKKMCMKPIPVFYNTNYSSEIEFYLYQKKATLIKKELNLVSILQNPNTTISKSKIKKFNNKSLNTIEIKQGDFGSFWDAILIPCLESKYQSNPVHSLEEINYLALKFPDNIKQYNAYFEDEIIAGITLFENNQVVKSQYGASNFLGEKMRALDFLFIHLIKKFKSEGKLYFDMGTVSNSHFEDGYNPGLLQQKEELGAVIFEQNHYEFSLESTKTEKSKL